MKIKLIAAFLSVAFFVTCSDNPNKDENIKYIESIYCENALHLIEGEDNLPGLILDLSKPTKSIKELKNAFSFNICNKKVFFNLPYDLKDKRIVNTLNSINLKTRASINCDSIYNSFDQSDILIFYTKEGRIAAKGEEVVKDSLPQVILRCFLSGEAIHKSTGIFLYWEKDANTDSLENVFKLIIDGYIETVNDLAKMQFGTELCLLSKKQLAYIRKTLPFEFELNLDIKFYEDSLPFDLNPVSPDTGNFNPDLVSDGNSLQ